MEDGERKGERDEGKPPAKSSCTAIIKQTVPPFEKTVWKKCQLYSQKNSIIRLI